MALREEHRTSMGPGAARIALDLALLELEVARLREKVVDAERGVATATVVAKEALVQERQAALKVERFQALEASFPGERKPVNPEAMKVLGERLRAYVVETQRTEALRRLRLRDLADVRKRWEQAVAKFEKVSPVTDENATEEEGGGP